MEKTLLVATTNQHKAAEIAAIFRDCGLIGWELRTLADYPDYAPPEEDGDSFAANAMIKAAAAAHHSGMPALADDSGLAVDALNGAPGIYSARYAGPQQDDADNRAKLLATLAAVPDEARGGAFVCAVALALPDAGGAIALWSCEGRCAGQISRQERGENGFGYDCLFYLPEHGMTMAELPPQLKNSVSHRGQAMRKAAALLRKLGESESI